MTSSRIAKSIVLALTISACSYDSDTDSEPSNSPLIGGTEVDENKFRSTLVVRGNCTVARVGPRHILSAAHCVVAQGSQALAPSYRPGAHLSLASKNTVFDGVTEHDMRVTVAKTHVIDVYLEGRPADKRVLESTVAPDIALIELTPDGEKVLGDIPIATIDLSPVKIADPVVIMGYGCEVNANSPSARRRRLKANPTKVISFGESGLKSASPQYLKFVDNGYFFTRGAAANGSEASLCPGDSGGPIYRDDNGENRIVGVNSYYIFSRNHGISISNWHTRFDLDSRFDVGSWLVMRGATSTGGRASSHYANCIRSAPSEAPICGLFAETYSTNAGARDFGAPLSDARYELRPGGPVWSQAFEHVVLEERDGKVVTLKRR